jgi:hypothetical protein
MKNAVCTRQFSNSELLYFLSAFAVAILFAMTLANLKPVVMNAGISGTGSLDIAASPAGQTVQEYRFEHNGWATRPLLTLAEWRRVSAVHRMP